MGLQACCFATQLLDGWAINGDLAAWVQALGVVITLWLMRKSARAERERFRAEVDRDRENRREEREHERGKELRTAEKFLFDLNDAVTVAHTLPQELSIAFERSDHGEFKRLLGVGPDVGEAGLRAFLELPARDWPNIPLYTSALRYLHLRERAMSAARDAAPQIHAGAFSQTLPRVFGDLRIAEASVRASIGWTESVLNQPLH